MERYCTSEGDTEGFVNMPLSIAEVRMSILAKEDNGRIRISIRSKRGTSANMCARMHFNGGGHENAAGGRLLVPENVKGIEDVGEYIERVTHIFLNDNEDN
jgi:phosphoesterase RecJ-like protein